MEDILESMGKSFVHRLRQRPQVRQQLRTLHIHAALHAAFRWDKARRFTSNDLYDFEHASAALATPSSPNMRCAPLLSRATSPLMSCFSAALFLRFRTLTTF